MSDNSKFENDKINLLTQICNFVDSYGMHEFNALLHIVFFEKYYSDDKYVIEKSKNIERLLYELKYSVDERESYLEEHVLNLPTYEPVLSLQPSVNLDHEFENEIVYIHVPELEVESRYIPPERLKCILLPRPFDPEKYLLTDDEYDKRAKENPHDITQDKMKWYHFMSNHLFAVSLDYSKGVMQTQISKGSIIPIITNKTFHEYEIYIKDQKTTMFGMLDTTKYFDLLHGKITYEE